MPVHVATPGCQVGLMMRGERVLITGGAGAIGSTSADELVARGAGEIVVLDNFVRGRRDNLAWAEANGPVTLVEGDIRDRALVHELMHGIDVVFHQAAIRITQCAEEPRLALEVLVDGTFNVFEAAVEEGVRKVVAASSASVYGLAEEFPTTERHHPYANDTLYGAAKTFNEGLLRSMHAMNGLDYVALRYFNVYGPRMDIHGVYTEVLVRWMERIEAGRAAAHPRRRHADHGLRLHRRRRARQRARRRGRRDRRGLQRRQRRRDEPARARASAAARHGLRPPGRARARARGQQGAAAPRRHVAPPASGWASRPRSTSRRG